MIAEALRPIRTYRFAPIAGVPFVHHVADGLDTVFADTERWPGSAWREEPVTVLHKLGGTSTENLDPVIDSAPWATYFRDANGAGAARFFAEPPWSPEHLLRTSRGGFEYSVTYETTTATPLDLKNVELALTTFVLADRRRGVLAHGCGFVLPDGTAVLSPGISGAGKSTLARLLRDNADDVRILNDDRVILTREHEHVHAWGAPWPGSEGIANPFDGPLGALAFIRHDDTCSVRTIAPRDAARRLYRTLALPLWSSEAMASALEFIDTRLLTLPLLELSYPATPGAGRWMADILVEHLAHVR